MLRAAFTRFRLLDRRDHVFGKGRVQISQVSAFHAQGAIGKVHLDHAALIKMTVAEVGVSQEASITILEPGFEVDGRGITRRGLPSPARIRLSLDLFGHS